MAKIIIQNDAGRTVATFTDCGGEFEAPITLQRGVPPDHDLMEALHAAREEDGPVIAGADPYEKTWTDQPDEVMAGHILCSFYLKEHGGVEVRRDRYTERLWLTMGNLFGSQTVRCRDALVVLEVIHRISECKPGKQVAKLPDGAVPVTKKIS